MVADFQQFYGVPLPLGGDIPDLPRFAALWSELPRESRTARRMNPDAAWDDATAFLRLIEYHLRALIAAQARACGSDVPEQAPLPSPGESARAAEAKVSAPHLTATQVAAALGYDRESLMN